MQGGGGVALVLPEIEMHGVQEIKANKVSIRVEFLSRLLGTENLRSG